MITLQYRTTTNPDFNGFRFYVDAWQLFDANDYATAYAINRHDIDSDSIHAVQDATGHLSVGERLGVTHEVTA